MRVLELRFVDKAGEGVEPSTRKKMFGCSNANCFVVQANKRNGAAVLLKSGGRNVNDNGWDVSGLQNVGE